MGKEARETGGRGAWTAGLGAAAQGACLSASCRRGAGLTWGSSSLPRPASPGAPSFRLRASEIRAGSLWPPSQAIPDAASSQRPVCCYSSEGQKVKTGLAGLKSRLDGDCPEAPGELLVPCGRIPGLGSLQATGPEKSLSGCVLWRLRLLCLRDCAATPGPSGQF